MMLFRNKSLWILCMMLVEKAVAEVSWLTELPKRLGEAISSRLYDSVARILPDNPYKTGIKDRLSFTDKASIRYITASDEVKTAHRELLKDAGLSETLVAKFTDESCRFLINLLIMAAKGELKNEFDQGAEKINTQPLLICQDSKMFIFDVQERGGYYTLVMRRCYKKPPLDVVDKVIADYQKIIEGKSSAVGFLKNLSDDPDYKALEFLYNADNYYDNVQSKITQAYDEAVIIRNYMRTIKDAYKIKSTTEDKRDFLRNINNGIKGFSHTPGDLYFNIGGGKSLKITEQDAQELFNLIVDDNPNKTHTIYDTSDNRRHSRHTFHWNGFCFTVVSGNVRATEDPDLEK